MISKLFILSLLFSCSSSAEPITTWVDEDGVRHYSSSRKEKESEEASLPEIGKYNSDSKIETLQEVSKKTCIKRGGIDCEAGPTKDGRVICADGYKGSKEKFDPLCNQIKLKYNIIKPSQRSDKRLLSLPIKAKVRNESRIEAKDVKVIASFPVSLVSDERKEYLLEGPPDIPPFGVAEYTYSGKLLDDRIIRKGTLKVKCCNCWNPADEKKNKK